MNGLTQAHTAAMRESNAIRVYRSPEALIIAAQTAEQCSAALLAQTISDLQHAVIRGLYVFCGHGHTPELASEAIDADALGCTSLELMKARAWQAAANGADAGDLFGMYTQAATLHYAETLVAMMEDGQRISFGVQK